LKKMKLDITHMLTKSTSPFYGIVPAMRLSHWAQLSCQLLLGNLGTTTVPSTSSSKSQTSRPPTMPSSADRLSPSSWWYPTTLTWYSRCQVQQVYSHCKGT
jgi:hypothetical protein